MLDTDQALCESLRWRHGEQAPEPQRWPGSEPRRPVGQVRGVVKSQRRSKRNFNCEQLKKRLILRK